MEPKSKTDEAHTFAPGPIGNIAARLAREIFWEEFKDLRPTKKHRLVPEITVTVSYREEKVDG